MSGQEEGKGYVIIGEAALSLALSGRKISVQSLINELGQMAKAGISTVRQHDISEASSWLKSFTDQDEAIQHVPYLHTLADLNDEMN
ncbi:hypothetical protein [Candidatus Pantoea soli]|uniref:Uncharacterized protein n=1 Tax=Candidatus Pantoea soli TaxID=3098669 RepID=A0A518XI98_9GAMM|nr:hypothetical protein [Pantoea soli]QDY43911.1 hypothetical protein D8B20_18450 [Pantoea soli]